MSIKSKILKIQQNVLSLFATLSMYIKKIAIYLWTIKKRALFGLNLLLIFLPPIILATPFPPYIGIYQIKLVQLQDVESKLTEVGIPDKVQSLGVPFFSRLTGIDTYTIKTQICLWNRNDVFLGGEYKSKKDLTDGAEAGAMEIKIEYADGEVAPLYSPRNEIHCLLLRDNSGTPIILKNEPVVRGPNPFGQPIVEENGDGSVIKIPVYSQGIDSAKTRVFAIPDFKSKEYFFNLVIFFLAWSLLYIHIIKIGKIIINSWRWSKRDKF